MTPKPRAPRHLRQPTRRWWDEVVREYVLEPHDLRLLQACCEAWDRLQQAREALASGLTYTDRFGAPRPRPEVAIERDAAIRFARLARDLRLDDGSAPSGEGY